MTDYSQFGEQPIIANFFGNATSGRFLDIGAYDGVTNSNTRGLLELGWSGVLVEAAPAAFDILVGNNVGLKTTLVHAAFMPKAGLVKFYDTDPRGKPGDIHLRQLCTAMQQHNVAHYGGVEYHVSACTAEDIVALSGDHFDFVSVDIEGLDLEVLPFMGTLLKNTRLLCFEDTVPCNPSGWDQAHYDKLLDAVSTHGFTKIVARTSYPCAGAPDGRMPGNTLITRP